MTTYNTKNPVPSADARDRYDNSQVFDDLMNGAAPSTPDRLGVLRQSWAGMEQAFAGSEADRAAAFQAFLEASGWSSLGTYAAGINIISHTQTVDYQGQPYQLKPSVPASLDAPHVTTGDWATEGVNFKLVGDNSLRQDLSSPVGGNNVGVTVGGKVTDVQSFASTRGIHIALGLGEGVDGTPVMQAAVNAWADDPNLTVRVVGVLDLQGTVQIPNKETDNPERRLNISGGSILKKNSGFMFTRQPGQSMSNGSGGVTQLQTGHVTFDNVRFLGPRGAAGTFILDGDNVIRTKFTNGCYGDGIQIVYAEEYLQSIYVDASCVFRKWSGWLFDCASLFDVKFYGTAEAGENFMRTRNPAADPAANSLAVRGCIEGLSGKVFEIGVCFGVVIDGNYQEQNAGGDYDFSVGTGFHKGLTLIGNGFQPSASQLANPNYYPVKLGKGAANSITLIGNSSTGNLFDVAVGNQSAVVDMGNWCAAGKLKFSPTSSRTFEFDGTELRAKLLAGIGISLNSAYQSVNFEQFRSVVSGENVGPGITMGASSPQLAPHIYIQKNWVVGSFVHNSAPSIVPRQYGSDVRNALLTGWSCTVSGTPGTWIEVPVILPY